MSGATRVHVELHTGLLVADYVHRLSAALADYAAGGKPPKAVSEFMAAYAAGADGVAAQSAVLEGQLAMVGRCVIGLPSEGKVVLADYDGYFSSRLAACTLQFALRRQKSGRVLSWEEAYTPPREPAAAGAALLSGGGVWVVSALHIASTDTRRLRRSMCAAAAVRGVLADAAYVVYGANPTAAIRAAAPALPPVYISKL